MPDCYETDRRELTGRSESRYRNASQLNFAGALLARCSAGIRVVGRRAGVTTSPLCFEVATDDGLAGSRKLLSTAIGDAPRESRGCAGFQQPGDPESSVQGHGRAGESLIYVEQPFELKDRERSGR